MTIPLHPLVPHAEGEVDVSVIFGTYNRMLTLRKCIDSIRKACAKISYEIVICDGGSTDGSTEWLAQQQDVVLLHGGLDGAVKAFNSCFVASRGTYILSLNDDVMLDEKSVANGLKHFDEPMVGQVAFAFGMPGKPVEILYCHGVPYVNYGLTRAALARVIATCCGGFWSTVYYTYGGDTELSMWVRRFGYVVAESYTSLVVDFHTEDSLRIRSHMIERGRSLSVFGHRWADPNMVNFRGPSPNLGKEETQRMNRIEQGELPIDRWGRLASADPKPGQFQIQEVPKPERVLHVYIHTDDDPQASMVNAFRKLGGDGFESFSWLGMTSAESRARCLRASQDLRPTIVFLQLQSPDAIPLQTVREIRLSPQRDPGLVCVLWSGDVGHVNGPWPGLSDQWSHEYSRVVDAMLYTGTGQVELQRGRGMVNAAYLQIGFDEGRYYPGEPGRRGSLHDIVFLGQDYGPQFSAIPRSEAQLRRDVVAAFTSEFSRFCAYGGGWGSGHLQQSRAGDIYRGSLMALSVSLVSDLGRYTSDRLFRAMACGTTVLCKRFSDCEGLGLEHEKNCLLWDTPAEAVALAKKWLNPSLREGLLAIGKEGSLLVYKHHTWDVRVRELAALVSTLRGEPLRRS
jgi:hypothetical protein